MLQCFVLLLAIATFSSTFPMNVDTIVPSAHSNAKHSLCRTALHYAVIQGKVDVVKDLLEKGADVNAVDALGRTALHYASVGEHSILFFLLVEGENFPAMDFKTLWSLKYCPVYRGSFPQTAQTVRLLVDAGFSPNVDLNHKIDEPVVIIMEQYFRERDYSLEIVEALIKNNAALNIRDMFGRTPLFLALESRFGKAAQTLIINGAGVNIPDQYGLTPIHSISRGNGWGDEFDHTLKVLCDYGGDVLLMDSRGMTPLHHAINVQGNQALYSLLLRGADVNARDFNDCTPLHYLRLKFKEGKTDKRVAAQLLKQDAYTRSIATLLINRGADISVKCHNDCMSREDMQEIIRPLVCFFCASPMVEQMGNIVPVSDTCLHRLHLACLEGLKGDPRFKGICPVCQVPMKKEMVEECFFCLDEFVEGKDNWMLVGKNCTHRIHVACREQFKASKSYKGVCALCLAAID